MTPNARKLAPEEVAELFPVRGHMDLKEYEVLFVDMKPGDAWVVDPGDVSIRAMKRRIGQAAKIALGDGASLKYVVTQDDNQHQVVCFKLKPTQVVKPQTDGRRKRANGKVSRE